MNEPHSYSASCPVCGYEHDFATKAAMSKAWAFWQRQIRLLRNDAKAREQA